MAQSLSEYCGFGKWQEGLSTYCGPMRRPSQVIRRMWRAVFSFGQSATFWLESLDVTTVMSDRVLADLAKKIGDFFFWPISRCFAGQTYRGVHVDPMFSLKRPHNSCLTHSLLDTPVYCSHWSSESFIRN